MTVVVGDDDPQSITYFTMKNLVDNYYLPLCDVSNSLLCANHAKRSHK